MDSLFSATGILFLSVSVMVIQHSTSSPPPLPAFVCQVPRVPLCLAHLCHSPVSSSSPSSLTPRLEDSTLTETAWTLRPERRESAPWFILHCKHRSDTLLHCGLILSSRDQFWIERGSAATCIWNSFTFQIYLLCTFSNFRMAFSPNVSLV